MPPFAPHVALPVRRNLKFPGGAGLTTSNPTLSDVVAALNQVQQNQAQILGAIDALQQSVNTLSANALSAGYTPGAGNIW